MGAMITMQFAADWWRNGDRMEYNTLKSVCWDITSRCNEYCKFCYRNVHNVDLVFEDNQLILKKLIDFGVDKISFVGGEPLLYERIFDLVQWGKIYCKDRTIFSITTNAILLTTVENGKIVIDEQRFCEMTDKFDWITFSLDASNSPLQNRIGRNERHFERIMTLLAYVKHNAISSKIKINTVVCRDNIDDLVKMYYLLKDYNVKRWKLFQFLPSRGNAAVYKDKYNILTEEFEAAVLKLTELNADETIKIFVNGYDIFDNSYITISSEGKLNVYNGHEYINPVDLKIEDVDNILKYINLNKHIEKRSDFLDA